MGENLPQPGQTLRLGIAAEVVPALPGLQQRLLHRVGRIELTGKAAVNLVASQEIAAKLRNAISHGVRSSSAGNGAAGVPEEEDRSTTCAVPEIVAEHYWDDVISAPIVGIWVRLPWTAGIDADFESGSSHQITQLLARQDNDQQPTRQVRSDEPDQVPACEVVMYLGEFGSSAEQPSREERGANATGDQCRSEPNRMTTPLTL